jgi:hypothetical protein
MRNRRILIWLWLLAVLALLVSGAESRGADRRPRTVHVTVALCDREHQGVRAVRRELADGQRPATNLYWGAQYGLRRIFDRAPAWRALPLGEEVTAPTDPRIRERRAWFAPRYGVRVVADAWDGRHIAAAVRAFLQVPGDEGERAPAPAADLRVYVGHNHLLDEALPVRPARRDRPRRPAMVFACRSGPTFAEHLAAARLEPLVTTTGLLAPEGYVVRAAVEAWARGEAAPAQRRAAAAAYARYQRCSRSAAERLFGVEREAAPALSAPAAAPADDRADPPAPSPARRVADLPCPAGFRRIAAADGSFGAWLRRLPLKPADAPVLDDEGRRIRPPAPPLAVVAGRAPSGVQDCAGTAVRLWGEYRRARRRRVAFRALSGDRIEYARWRQGRYAVSADGSRLTYTPGGERADSDETFARYLRFVMAYVNSAALARDLQALRDGPPLAPGTLYIQAARDGRYGHVSLVLDACRDGDGRRLYLFGYGYTPAQEMILPRPGRRQGAGGWWSVAGFLRHVAPHGGGAWFAWPGETETE